MERNLKPRYFETSNFHLINKRADIPGDVVGPVVGAAVVVGAVVVVDAAVVVGAAVFVDAAVVVGAAVLVGAAVVVRAAVVVGAAVDVGTSFVGFDCVAVVNSVDVAEAYFKVNLLNPFATTMHFFECQ